MLYCYVLILFYCFRICIISLFAVAINFARLNDRSTLNFQIGTFNFSLSQNIIAQQDHYCQFYKSDRY